MQQILALIVLVMMVYGCGKFVFRDSKSDNTLPPAPPQQTQPVYLYTTEQKNEMVNGFNLVMSDVLKPLYAGCYFNGLESVKVYVTDDWQQFNAEQKKNIIDRVFRIYAGMLSARNFKTIIQSMEIQFVLKSTNKVVGSWDSHNGVRVY